MHRDEYLRILASAVSSLPESERREILADYDEHFVIGMAEGRTDVDIASALGDPRSIGREFAALSLVKRAEENPSAGYLSRAVIATVGLGIFNLLVVFVPFVILILILATILVIGFSLACAGPFLTGYAVLTLAGVTIMQLDSPPVAMVFYGIGMTSLGLLCVALDFWLMKVLYRQAITYLKWNIAVISGRESL